jgi:putative SOS response-associated peptidase YedK
MCGRYVLKAPEDISERFQLRQFNLHLSPVYNAAPSMELPVIVENEGGDWEAKLMRWGLIPRWAKPGDKTVAPINARAETLLEKPMFRSLVGRKRCLVPASGFYEWKQQQGRKQPYFVSLPDESTFALAGLYDEFQDKDGAPIASYTIVTTQPNDLMATLHNRMPVILPRRDEEEWLSREVTDPVQVERLLVPFPTDAMTAWPVSPAVNNVRNDDPRLIEPLAEADSAAPLASNRSSGNEDQQQGKLFD